jgi:hypothetical protein
MLDTVGADLLLLAGHLKDMKGKKQYAFMFAGRYRHRTGAG